MPHPDKSVQSAIDALENRLTVYSKESGNQHQMVISDENNWSRSFNSEDTTKVDLETIIEEERKPEDHPNKPMEM